MSMKKILSHGIVIILILCLFVSDLPARQKAKSIILMVPDGMSIANVTAARIHVYGPGKGRLHFETLEQIGYQSTHSANSIVTDSAAAASAWACGQKFRNGEISFHNETKEAPKTILELARDLGKSTGLVATATITHATPAAFGAHVGNRGCEQDIARQYLAETGVDVLLGGGIQRFRSEKPDPCGTSGDLIESAVGQGYKVVYTGEQMESARESRKLLGLFSDQAMKPAHSRTGDQPVSEPGLAEMARTALHILEKNDKGFFLLVEGSQVDWGNHQNFLPYTVSEILEFDRAVAAVLDWVEQKGCRKDDTLIIVVPDHDCGGFAVKGPYGATFTEPGQWVEAGWVSKKHTAEDTMIWSQGPYSEYLGRAIDNTDIFHIMKAALHGRDYIPPKYQKKKVE
jgi:alkaline phosphatase